MNHQLWRKLRTTCDRLQTNTKFIVALLAAVFLGNQVGLAQAKNAQFKEEEVTFKNGKVTLAGTLTLPKTKGKHPAIVLITGSGPQNRDEEILGFKVFKQISDELVSKGIAVLRYDDRGVGKSTGNLIESTSEDFAEDVVAAVKLLEGRKDINPKQIGLFGHSEGGTVAPLAYTKYPSVAFIITMAGTTVSGSKIIEEQEKAMMVAAGKTKEEVAAAKKRRAQVMNAIRTNKGWDEIKRVNMEVILKEIEKLPKEKKVYIPDPKAYAESYMKQQMKAIQSPWYIFFILHDPQISLVKTTCPVLALYGEKDLQVLPDQNLPPLKKALKKAGNKDVTIKVLKDANHLFQKAKTGSPTEYAQLPKKFVTDFLPTISQWLLKRVDIVR